MKLPVVPATTGITTFGATGIVLMVLHITGDLSGWAWPFLYVFLILVGSGQENRK